MKRTEETHPVYSRGKIAPAFAEPIRMDYRIELLGHFFDCRAYRVNGTRIRNERDIEFTNAGHGRDFAFIPADEVWVDASYATSGSGRRDELCLAGQCAAELAAFGRGMTREQAMGVGRRTAFDLRLSAHRVRRDPRIRRIAPHVWLVDGCHIRDCYDIDFTEGGHGLVYPRLIPRDDVWIDDALSPSEWPFVAVHEYDERLAMREGVPYADAHASASAYELDIRRNSPWQALPLVRMLSRGGWQWHFPPPFPSR